MTADQFEEIINDINGNKQMPPNSTGANIKRPPKSPARVAFEISIPPRST
jgi:hypothetical protein